MGSSSQRRAATGAERDVSRRQPTLLQRVVSVRRVAQVSLGAALWFALSKGWVGLGTIITLGSLAGVVLGKFFCRWMCPMGAFMETLVGVNDPDGRHRALYGYFKLGCPISWAQGLLNRVSLWRVRVEPTRCTHCARCDRACYVAQLAPGHSLHAAAQANPSTHFSCSRCLQCVEACPTGALGLGLVPMGRPRGG